MFCTKCGKPLEDGATLCPDCAADVVPTASKAPKAAKFPHKQGVPAQIGCVVLSVLLCLSLLAASCLTILRSSFSVAKLDRWITNIDLTGIRVAVEGDKDGVALTEYLYDIAQSNCLELTKRDINDLLDDPLIDKFLSSVATEYHDYLLKGSNKQKGISTDMILDFIQDNEDEIKAVILDRSGAGYDDLKFDYERLEKNLDENLGEALSIQGLNKATGNALATARIVLGPVALILAWLVCALLALGLVLANLHRVSSLLFYIGIPVLITGVALCLASLAGALAPMMLAELPFVTGDLSFITGEGSVLQGFSVTSLIFGSSLLAAGLLMIVVHVVVRKFEKKRLAAVNTVNA